MPRKARGERFEFLLFGHAIVPRRIRRGLYRENNTVRIITELSPLFLSSERARARTGPESAPGAAPRVDPSLIPHPSFIPLPPPVLSVSLSSRIFHLARVKRKREKERGAGGRKERGPRDRRESMGPADRLVGGRQPAAKQKRSLPSVKDNRALPSSSPLRWSILDVPAGWL